MHSSEFANLYYYKLISQRQTLKFLNSDKSQCFSNLPLQTATIKPVA